MIINKIRINGFGIFNDFNIDSFSNNINFFYGPNESGKTTLYNFINYIFFGSENISDYIPYNGSEFGGTITLSYNNSLYKVERRKNTYLTIDQNGKVIDNSPQNIFLNNINRSLYNHIYSLNLEELENFNFKNKDINNFIFSSVTGLKNMNLLDFKEKVKEKLSDDSVIKIDNLIKEIEMNEEKINLLEKDFSNYFKYNNDIISINKELNNIQEKLNQLNIKKSLFENSLKIYDLYIEKKHYFNESIDIKHSNEFPNNGIERYKTLINNKNFIQKDIDTTEIKINNLKKQIDSIDINYTFIDYKDSINHLINELDSYKETKNLYNEIFKKYTLNKDELETALRKIGSEWNTKRLNAININSESLNNANNFKKEFDDIRFKISSIDAKINSNQNTLHNLKERKEKKIVELKNYESNNSIDDIKERRKNLFYLQKLKNEIVNKENERDFVKNQIGNLNDDEDFNNNKILKLEKTYFNKRLIFCFYVSFIFAFPLGFFVNEFVGIILGIFSFFSIIITKSRNNVIKKEIDDINDKNLLIKNKIESFYNKIKSINEKLINLEFDSQKALKFLKIDDINQINFDEFFENLDHIYEESNQIKKLKDDIDNVNEDILLIQKNIKNDHEQLYDLQSEKEHLLKDWKKWIRNNNYDESLNPEDFDNFVKLIEKSNELYRIMTINEIEFLKLKEKLESFENKTKNLYAELNLTDYNINDINKINDLLIKNISNLKEKNILNNELEVLIEKNEKNILTLKSVENQIEYLLKSSSAKNENDFFDLSRLNTKYTNLQNKIEKIDIEIKKKIDITTIKDLEEIIDNNTADDINNELENYIKEINELKFKLNENNDNLEILKSIVYDIENNDELLFLKNKNLNLKKIITTHIKKYIEEKLINIFINNTIDYFEKNKKMLFQKASNNISYITDNLYKIIFENNKISLIDENGFIKNEKIWSAGTIGQVYLSTRLAFIEDISNNSNRLPVILDDLLVKSDLNRKEKMLELILNFSKCNQVFIFTNNQNTFEIFKNIVEQKQITDYKLFELFKGKLINENQ